MPAVVAVQPVAAERVAHGAGVLERHARDGAGRIVHDEQVQVAVAVVVEEHRLGRVSRVRDAVGGRHLDEGRHPVRIQALIDPELVGAERSRHFAGLAHVDVESPVAVHVGQRDACGPRPVLVPQARLSSDVPKVELPLVQVQPRAALIGGEHDLRQPIARQVADRDAAAVVEITVGEDVQVVGLGETILESHAGVAGGEQGEQPAVSGGRCGGPGGTRAGGDETHSRDQKL